MAKRRGETSFAALRAVKEGVRGFESGCGRPDGRKKRVKVGHTGTLDAFADGLLVVLTGKMTKLAPYITALPKRYRALVRFGVRTDTLDPFGSVVFRAGFPSAEKLEAVLPAFSGTILQTPPEYSALKRGGKRLSDLARDGAVVSPEPREITVYALRVETFFSPSGTAFAPGDSPPDAPVAAAIIDVSCSKGTYIRALARDVANAAGSAAFLFALRRLSVGPFSLEAAAGGGSLPRFEDFVTPALFADSPLSPAVSGTVNESEAFHGAGGKGDRTVAAGEISFAAVAFSPEIAAQCGFGVLALKKEFLPDFSSGRQPRREWFFPNDIQGNAASRFPVAGDGRDACIFPHGGARKKAVFCGGVCAGVVSVRDGRFSYDFVSGRDV